jgi:hypothetical protein
LEIQLQDLESELGQDHNRYIQDLESYIQQEECIYNRIDRCCRCCHRPDKSLRSSIATSISATVLATTSYITWV